MPVPWAVLIPARLGSTRLPRKVLRADSGLPLVMHTVARAQAAPGDPLVLVLTDHAEVADAVRTHGGEVRMTSPEHASGTDRCAEAAQALDVEVVVNLQADEPFVVPEDLADLARAAQDPAVGLATLGHPFQDTAHRQDDAAVKALRDEDGLAVAFQRADPTPERLAALGHPAVLHHLGIYAFRRERLAAFTALPPSTGEQRERLEQLRALDAGWRIPVLDARAPAFGVDTEADYARFLARLADEGS